VLMRLMGNPIQAEYPVRVSREGSAVRIRKP
jgi:hypothetical protein